MADVDGGTADVVGEVISADGMVGVAIELVVVVVVHVLEDVVAAAAVDVVGCTADGLTCGACTVETFATGSAQQLVGSSNDPIALSLPYG